MEYRCNRCQMEFGKNKHNYRQHISRRAARVKDADRYIANDILEYMTWEGRSDYAVFCLYYVMSE